MSDQALHAGLSRARGPGRLARLWFAVVTGLALGAVVAGAAAQAQRDPFGVGSPLAAAANSFAFWTMQSNVLVALAAAGLARGAADQPVTRALRLTALTAITVTGVIFNTLLGGRPGEGLQALHSDLAHVAVPLLFVIGWAMFGHCVRFSWRDGVAALAFPLLWTTLTLARGAVDGWYPYWFLDVGRSGPAQVALNVGAIGMLYVALASALVWFDRMRGRAGRGRAHPNRIDSSTSSPNGTER